MTEEVWYDGECLSDWFQVANIVRPAPGIRNSTTEVPGRSGLTFAGNSLASPTLSMTLIASGMGAEGRRDAMRQIARLLVRDEPKRLAISSDGGLYYMAVVDGALDMHEYVRTGTMEVTFLVPDPLMYGEERSVTIAPEGYETVMVDGTATTYPRIEAPSAIGPVWGVTVDDQTSVKIRTGTEEPARVTVDCETRETRVDGAVRLPTLDSDWIGLSPGLHKIATDYGTGECTVTYVERWM